LGKCHHASPNLKRGADGKPDLATSTPNLRSAVKNKLRRRDKFKHAEKYNPHMVIIVLLTNE